MVVAIVYGTHGGMSDVGKFAVANAVKQGVAVRVVAMSLEEKEGTDKGFEVDVTNKTLVKEVEEALSSTEITKLDVAAADTVSRLGEIFEGCEAVIACLGNRQPSMPRWCGIGAEKVCEAMKNKSITRLVILSSMGVGDDNMPAHWVKYLWGCLLATFLRSAKKDLVRLEEAVTTSNLNYLLVRPVGLDPGVEPEGDWEIVTCHEERNNLRRSLRIPKKDCAAFMLEEALNPKHSKTGVTIGQKRKKTP